MAPISFSMWPSGKVLSGAFNGIRGVPQNFIACDREQSFLLPPSLLEWVPEDHLVWTILGAVDELDLSAIYRAYRPDGDGRPAYEPRMMVALVLYSYAKGIQSSREIA